jgi:hypothetical protein
MTNNKWVCIERGKLELEYKNLPEEKVENDPPENEPEEKEPEETLDILPEDKAEPNWFDSIKGKIINANKKVKSGINRLKTDERFISVLCQDHNNFSTKFFKEKYPNLISFELIKDFNQSSFKTSEKGKFIAIKFTDNTDANYYVFYAKNTPVSNYTDITQIFEMDKTFAPGIAYKNWRIIRPAIFKEKAGEWTLIEKGKLTI